MVRPGIWVNENLYDGDHSQQWKCCETRGKTEEQEDWPREFIEHRKSGRHFRSQHRYLVFIFEELYRKFKRVVFEKTCIKKHHPDTDSHHQLENRPRKTRKPLTYEHEPVRHRSLSLITNPDKISETKA